MDLLDRLQGRFGAAPWAALLLGAAAVAQPVVEPPYRLAPEVRESGTTIPRHILLERRFFEAEEWQFYHSVASLPEDMKIVLRRAVGERVVGPGETFDQSDVIESFPPRVQHLYTAVTERLGVIVWYTGGFSGLRARAVLYARDERDACRYNFDAWPVMTLRMQLRMLIEHRGASQGGCEYLPPVFFD